MKRSMTAFASLALLVAMPSLALAETPHAEHAATGYTSAETTIGTLLDDPAAKAILLKNLPAFMASGRADMARGLTLKSLQTYAPDMFSDKALADIDAEFAKLPAKK